MRRNPFQRRSTESRGESRDQEYWISYSDLMAGLLMVFVLMLLVASFRYNLSAAEEETQAQRLEDVRQRVIRIVETMAVRDSIIDDLQAIGGTDILVDTITAGVRMRDAVLFDEGRYDLKPEGRAVVALFAERYLPVILKNQRYRAHLREIAIEGHTNDNGAYDYNMRLSQNRAYAVMESLLAVTNDPEVKRFLEEYLTARGRSESQVICNDGRVDFPLDCGASGVDKIASRRIEIRFRLDDEEVVREVMTAMAGE